MLGKSLSAWALLFLLRLYMMLLAPFVGGACKFYPSCSNYAYEAVSRHGARRGSVLAVKRLLRCRPFTQGGFDPVPEELPGLESSPVDCAEAAAETASRQLSAEPAADLRGLELRQ
ncbi:MAG: membrane protein insertion efficiency factor YidD [Candidatus Acidiferrales bacterium]